MSFNNQITYSPATLSTTYFAASVTGATFTLTNTAVTDNLAHQVTVLNNTATDHSGKTLTFTGTDQDGKAQTETIAAPAGSATVTTTKYYLTLTSVTVSATIGSDTFSIGYKNTFVSPTIPCNWRGGMASIDVTVTGTINFGVEQSWDDIQTKTPPFTWVVNNAGETNLTAKTQIVLQALPKAYRLNVASYSASATITISFIQRDK
jgi:hypothetical protein